MYLSELDLFVVGLYLAGLFWIGIYFSRRQTSGESYFLGGRRIPWYLAGVSLLATLLSTISYLSLPGELIRFGIGFFTSYLALVFVVPVITHLIVPYLMRLPVTSVYEYLERRYGVGTRRLGALVFVFTRIIWIGLILYTASFALTTMTGWSIATVVLLIGVVTTFYTTSGGMSAVVWSDFIQFTILFGGAIFIPLFVLFQTDAGPLVWWEVFSQAGRASVPVVSFDPSVRITVTGMILVVFLWNICTHGADQVAAQRYLSTSSVREARRSVWIYAVANVALVGTLAVTGLALFYFSFHQQGLPVQEFQEAISDRADRVLPEFVARELPPGVSGLLLAALLAAAMSSLSSGINSISTVLVTDLFGKAAGRRSGRHGLFVPRVLAGLTGILGMTSALVVDRIMRTGDWNLLELMERANHLFVAPLGVLFFVGLLSKRVGAEAALLGFVLGVATSSSISFSRELFGLEQSISFMWIMPASFVVSLLGSYLLSFLFHPPTPHQLEGLSRKRAPVTFGGTAGN